MVSWRRLAIGALACTLLAASCGSSTDTDDGDGAHEDTPTEAAGSSSDTDTAEPTTSTTEPISGDAASNDDASPDGAGPNDTGPDDTAAPAAGCIPAPPDLDEILFLPDWSQVAGRQLEYQEVKVSGGTRPAGAGLTPVELTVVEVDDEGTAFLWENQDTVVDVAGLLGDVTAEELFDGELPRQRVAYRLDADRYWAGVTNIDQLRADMATSMELLLAMDLPDPESLQQVADFFTALPDADLAALLTEPMQTYHHLEGVALGIDERIEGPDQLPNNFGGPPFPAWTTIEITELVDDEGCVRVEIVTTIDGETALPLIMESMEALFPGGAQTEQDQAELDALAQSFDITNHIVGQYDSSTGFFHRIAANQLVDAGSERREEAIIITDVTPAG